jgi:hypothetical protein
MNTVQIRLRKLRRLISKFNIAPVTVIRDWMRVDKDACHVSRLGDENEQH